MFCRFRKVVSFFEKPHFGALIVSRSLLCVSFHGNKKKLSRKPVGRAPGHDRPWSVAGPQKRIGGDLAEQTQ